jgi:hypothetical protein
MADKELGFDRVFFHYLGEDVGEFNGANVDGHKRQSQDYSTAAVIVVAAPRGRAAQKVPTTHQRVRSVNNPLF